MFLAPHSRVRVEDLLRGLIVSSGNDAAITLAEGVAGAEEAFIMRMNRRAAELGLANSRYGNPWGKAGEDQKVTARDMVRLAAHVVQTYPDRYKLFAEREFLWNKIKQPNRNPLLSMSIGADGLATGMSTIRGSASSPRPSRKVAGWCWRCTGPKPARTARKKRASCCNGASAISRRSRCSRPARRSARRRSMAARAGSVPLVAARDVTALLQRGGGEKLTARIVYEGPVVAPIEAGAPIGRLEVRRGATRVLDEPLRAGEAVDIGPLHRRAFDAAYEYVAGAIAARLKKK